jgi:hypothetical protein
MSLVGVKRLIRRLKEDFGLGFIVTLAPVYPAMLARYQGFNGIAQRLLNPSAYTKPDPVTAAVCRARNLRNKRNLSGFNYLELGSSPEGKLVDWYNVQMYCGWGDPLINNIYESIIDVGWPPEKIVLGVITNPTSGSGYRTADELSPVLERLNKKYNGKWGGVMGWELFNAVPWKTLTEVLGGISWVEAMTQGLGRPGVREQPVEALISQGYEGVETSGDNKIFRD